MKKFTRNTVKKIVDKLFGSIIMEIVGEDKANHCSTLVRDVIRENDFVCMDDYDFDSFISDDDYDFDSFISDDDYDLDDFITCQDFNPNKYDFDSFLTTQEFDADDFVRCDDFDPDDYVRCQDCDPDDFVHTSDFDSDDFVTKDEFDDGLNCFEKKLVTPTTQREVISFLTKLTLCATDYCTEALQAEGTTNG
tara:strand:+ start:376 stop:954 length:579 start_codon:yes stop_codon:yes gene_type:complete